MDKEHLEREVSSDHWQKFYRDYEASNRVSRWKKWCLLTKPQQEYLQERFSLEPPEPARD
ncbi:MAG: hypothetical protein ACWGQW_10445 [bacterium]